MFPMETNKYGSKKTEMPVWARVCAGIFGTAFVGLGIFGFIVALDPFNWKFMVGAVGLFGLGCDLVVAAVTGSRPVMLSVP